VPREICAQKSLAIVSGVKTICTLSRDPPDRFGHRSGSDQPHSSLVTRAPRVAVIEYKQMQQQKHTWKGRAKSVTRKVRELAVVGQALASTRHVVMAQIVPMRFCNLSCAYCNEYDKVSQPVALEEMARRIDHLARLGSRIITISGGEPLTHPELDGIIARIRHHGRVAGMITNGYLLMPERIERLNRAGLDHMQISIDNIEPDEISKKSLKVLDKKLEFLSRYAEFLVNINSVVGGGI
jgi:uncharacterized Fe-S cluster-containing radical SAM superfamily enzyme